MCNDGDSGDLIRHKPLSLNSIKSYFFFLKPNYYSFYLYPQCVAVPIKYTKTAFFRHEELNFNAA